MKSQLDRKLKRHYESQRLPEEDVRAILGEGAPAASQRSGSRAAIAAAALLLVAVVVMLGPQSGPSGDQLARDVVMNHQTYSESDWRADSISALANEVQGFPIALRAPRSSHLDGAAVGGRLCSLAGAPAMHVQLDRRSQHGEPQSLFITSVRAARSPVSPGTMEFRGVLIDIWIEGDTVYALARG